MKNKKIKIFYTILTCLVILVFSYIYAHINKMNVLYDKNTDTGEYISTGVVGEGIIEQTFLCTENSLDGMNVKCQLFGDATNLNLRYELIENNSGEVVAKGEIAGNKLNNNQFSELYFEEDVTDCNNKQYTFNLQVLNASEDNRISFCYESKSEEGMKLVIDGEENEGTLIAKTITKRFDLETFIVVVGFLGFIWLFLKVLYRLFK